MLETSFLEWYEGRPVFFLDIVTVYLFSDGITVNDQTLFEQTDYLGIAHHYVFGFCHGVR